MDYQWPDSLAGPVISKEIAHAIGLVAINWSWCEQAQEFILSAYIKLDGRTTDAIIKPMPNNLRDDLLGELLKHVEKDAARKEAGAHFRTCFSICLENRNFVVHSAIAPADFVASNPVAFVKSAKRASADRTWLRCDPHEISQTATELAVLFTFGMDLFWSVVQDEPPPLLGKLPKPRKLILGSEGPPTAVGPPPSSRT